LKVIHKHCFAKFTKTLDSRQKPSGMTDLMEHAGMIMSQAESKRSAGRSVRRSESQVSEAYNLKVTIGALKFAGRTIQSTTCRDWELS
jgi:hypothetical protein